MYKYYWAGIVSGKLDHFPSKENGADYPVAIMPAIFKTKSEAKRRYQDVRKVRLVAFESTKHNGKKDGQ